MSPWMKIGELIHTMSRNHTGINDRCQKIKAELGEGISTCRMEELKQELRWYKYPGCVLLYVDLRSIDELQGIYLLGDCTRWRRRRSKERKKERRRYVKTDRLWLSHLVHSAIGFLVRATTASIRMEILGRSQSHLHHGQGRRLARNPFCLSHP